MNDIFYKNNIQKKFLIEKLSKKLTKNFFKIFDNISLDIKDNNKTLNILNDKYKLNFNIKDLKVFNRFKTIAIIGMGGSILGSEAIYSFLKTKIKKNFYFFDDLNTKKNLLFKEKENLNKVLFIAISKSGNTIETLSNLTDLKILKKNAKNIIIISEKNNNQLFRIANKFNLFFIEHKKNIGGRYSVLSEIGLVPAILMGINFKKLRKNTLKFFKGKHKLFLKESTIKLANLLKTKTNIFVSLNPFKKPNVNKTYKVIEYAHPNFDFKTFEKQKEIDNIQGKFNTWFCGAYLGYGFHEDGISSSLNVAKKIYDVEKENFKTL